MEPLRSKINFSPPTENLNDAFDGVGGLSLSAGLTLKMKGDIIRATAKSSKALVCKYFPKIRMVKGIIGMRYPASTGNRKNKMIYMSMAISHEMTYFSLIDLGK